MKALMDFLTGMFLANALPHFMVGILNVRFLSLFGYAGSANIYYSYFCVILSLVLFHLNYGLINLPGHMGYVGGLFLVLIYFVTGRFFVQFFKR